jgi:hypothetical protein
LAWSEVEAAVAAEDPAALRFDAHQVLARVADGGDRFEAVLTTRQRLPAGPPSSGDGT